MTVAEYFNSIAKYYASWYRLPGYSSYFFKGRMNKSIEGISFINKTILDVGAGNGELFDVISAKGRKHYSSYFAIDFSEKMLEFSSIPSADRYCGNYLEYELIGKFDLIFCLGVTSYMSNQEVIVLLNKIYTQLEDNGQAIISFTNSQSISIKLNHRLKKSSYIVNCYSKKEINDLILDQFSLISYKAHDCTIYPINVLFPKFSRIASMLLKFLEKHSPFHSEIIVTITKKGTI